MTREQYIKKILWYLSQIADDAVKRVFWFVDRMYLRSKK